MDEARVDYWSCRSTEVPDKWDSTVLISLYDPQWIVYENKTNIFQPGSGRLYFLVLKFIWFCVYSSFTSMYFIQRFTNLWVSYLNCDSGIFSNIHNPAKSFVELRQRWISEDAKFGEWSGCSGEFYLKSPYFPIEKAPL